MKFWKDIEYRDERGAMIVERVVSDTEKQCDTPSRFFGKGMTALNTPMGEIPREFEVELDADTIEEAFQVFEDQMNEKGPAAAEEVANALMEELKEQMRDKSSGIITPDQMMGALPNPHNMG